jgi:Peptidase propeptide and YPEB domain
MRSLFLPLAALLTIVAAPAGADRPLTDQERAKLMAAIVAAGCSGGKLEFDDGKYEVDDARCGDGRTYDLKFNAEFQLIAKQPER